MRTYKQRYSKELAPGETFGSEVMKTFRGLGVTMRRIAQDKAILIYMIAFFFYIDGVHTVISMATTYGTSLGIDSTQLILALLVTQFVAFPSAIAYGKLSGKYGTLRMIIIAVVAYVAIVLFAAFFLKTAVEFWILAVAVGLFQGGIQALSRSYFGKLIPKERSNEYYGFFDIFGRYASVMGTLLVSVVTSLTGDASLGVLSIGILLIVGLVMLIRLSACKGMAYGTGRDGFRRCDVTGRLRVPRFLRDGNRLVGRGSRPAIGDGGFWLPAAGDGACHWGRGLLAGRQGNWCCESYPTSQKPPSPMAGRLPRPTRLSR